MVFCGAYAVLYTYVRQKAFEMAKPTKEEFEKAIKKAQQMRELGQDPDYLGKSLLNLNYRIGYLEEVYRAIERYLRSGMAEREHTLLLKAVEKARYSDERTSAGEHTDFGLS